MTIFQLIRANSAKLNDQSLRYNLMSWSEFTRTNSLAPLKLVKETEKLLFIEDGLPWKYQFTPTGEPIALDISKLLSVVYELDTLLYQYKYNTNDGLPRDLEQEVLSLATATITRTEGSNTLALRLLMEKLIGTETLEPFLQIATEHMREMGVILRLLDNQSAAVKGRMNKLEDGETTPEKYAQVRTLLDIDTLHQSAEIETLRLIYNTIVPKTGELHLSQFNLLAPKRGDFFFINLDARF